MFRHDIINDSSAPDMGKPVNWFAIALAVDALLALAIGVFVWLVA